MNTRRVAKAAEAIRESVSMTILVGLRDPRVKNVTVLRAEVSGDLRSAKVYVSVMGDAKAQSLTMHGLESARGFIQAKVADRLQTKNTPVLKFVLDPGLKNTAETSQALRAVMPDESSGSHQDDDPLDEDDEAIEDDADIVDDESQARKAKTP
ncbi:30S ribosome-binding factor RbfA [Schlesneria paludicola]|uniref:30S ribosome-binding factor RbfA n=1 Tax=Schlesneria paludicola TaxID=360056 RepID=UPI00029AF68D|nr:30S ribosome-binding factor RbfA [Schlesneria paludicola]